MDPVNPFLAVRRRDGLSRVELARRLGLAYTDVVQVENGYLPRLPRRVCRALDELGEDAAAAMSEYQQWREARRRGE